MRKGISGLPRRFPVAVDVAYSPPPSNPKSPYYSKELKAVAEVLVASDGSGDYEDIQTAIDSLPSEGGIVYLKAGTYSISSPITIKRSDVSLVGTRGAVIKPSGDIHGILINDDSGHYSHISIRDIELDCSSMTGTHNGIDISCSSSSYSLTDCEISNCYVHNAPSCGARAEGYVYGLSFVNNLSSSNSENGIFILGYGDSYSSVINNVCRDNSSSGIFMYCPRSSAIGNHCSGNSGSGIKAWKSRLVISSNHCKSNSEAGIWTDKADYSTFANNFIELNQQHGLYVRRSSYCSINGNVLLSNSQEADDTYSEIILTDLYSVYSTHNVVFGNIIRCLETNKAKYGIRENSSSDDYNIILGNQVNGARTANISTQGANTEVAHNIA